MKVLWSVTAGLAAGLVTGLIVAPAAGADTRTRIGDWTANLFTWGRQPVPLANSPAAQRAARSARRKADKLQPHADELIHSDFNAPSDLPHRVR